MKLPIPSFDSAALAGRPPRTPAPATRLRPFVDFGANPGALLAWSYVPATAGAKPPLVVVLHGCTQTAAGYDAGAGWSDLADELGFVLLFPEQQRANNPNLCFNWFEPGDARRGAGEPQSIHDMTLAAVARFGCDASRVFVTGLSAGGAMTSAMLACYPETFAGGAIVAGLPYGVASGMAGAFASMRGRGLPDAAALGAAVRGASPHTGRWPRVSVWHGTADTTVAPANADAILDQWRSVHADLVPGAVQTDGLDRHRMWSTPDGIVQIEDHRIQGLAHGTPIQASGAGACGTPAPFILEAGIASTRRIADFWGLTAIARTAAPGAEPRTGPRSDRPAEPRAETVAARASGAGKPKPEPAAGVAQVIERALRAAGLMR